jgi:hypothetical protein
MMAPSVHDDFLSAVKYGRLEPDFQISHRFGNSKGKNIINHIYLQKEGYYLRWDLSDTTCRLFGKPCVWSIMSKNEKVSFRSLHAKLTQRALYPFLCVYRPDMSQHLEHFYLAVLPKDRFSFIFEPELDTPRKSELIV